MMDKLWMIVLAAGIFSPSFNINNEKVESNVKKNELIILDVAKNVLDETTYTYVNTKTGAKISRITDENYSPDLNIESPYNEWKYWNGVLGIAMLELYQYTGESKYKEFAVKNVDFMLNGIDYFRKDYTPVENPWHYPFGLLYRLEILDDFGAAGAGMADVYLISGNNRYKAYIDTFAHLLSNKILRHTDGTFVRDWPKENTLWADDLYMSVPLLARIGHLYNSDGYFQDAAFQVKSFHEKLFSPHTQLYYHCWYTGTQQNGVAHWGRANGWVMLAKTELIRWLPDGHPEKKNMISLLKKQIDGVIEYQNPNGLYHQVLNKNDSYLETSASSMFTYSIARAVNEGWLDESYIQHALKGWEGIKTKINSQGLVEDICVGTGIEDSIEFYYNRPTELNDIHGLGAVLLAGIEVVKYQSKQKQQ